MIAGTAIFRRVGGGRGSVRPTIALVAALSIASVVPAVAAARETAIRVGGQTSDQDRAAVIAAENGWEAAEVKGDVAFLDALLAPDYVSVSSNGNVYNKEQIKRGAQQQAARDPNAQPALMDASSTIDIYGDLALVHHHGKQSISVDILQRRNGHWIAVYSQHSKITGLKDTSD